MNDSYYRNSRHVTQDENLIADDGRREQAFSSQPIQNLARNELFMMTADARHFALGSLSDRPVRVLHVPSM